MKKIELEKQLESYYEDCEFRKRLNEKTIKSRAIMNVNIGKPTACKCGETAGKGIISLNLQGVYGTIYINLQLHIGSYMRHRSR